MTMLSPNVASPKGASKMASRTLALKGVCDNTLFLLNMLLIISAIYVTGAGSTIKRNVVTDVRASGQWHNRVEDMFHYEGTFHLCMSLCCNC